MFSALSLVAVVQSQGTPAPLPADAGAIREPVRTGLPARLQIPRIDVDATVEHVGLAPDGAMDVPKESPMNAAWYELGPRPGETGSSVIDGHFGTDDGRPAVFDDLHELRPGDRLQVEDAGGATVTFVVREFRTYKPDEDATAVFRSGTGRAHLNLITCTGVWNQAKQTYSDRLVVFADKETGFELTRLGLVRTERSPGYDITFTEAF